MKLVVGIDVDGVLVDSDYFENIATQKFGNPKHPEEYYTSDRYGITYDEVEKLWDEYRKDYIMNAPTVKGIESLGSYLSKNNIPHYVITNRGDDAKSEDEKRFVCSKTEEMVRTYFPNVNDIIFNGIGTKLPECLKNGITVMIEDCANHVKTLSDYMYCILVERDHNIGFSHPRVIHVKDLSQVPPILESLSEIMRCR